jgi:hypothetical protein
MSVQEITERLAAEVSAVKDGRLAGILVVPIQREADAAALTELARHRAAKERPSGRHRASTSDGHDAQDHADRGGDGEDRARDADPDEHEHEDRNGRTDREDCDERGDRGDRPVRDDRQVRDDRPDRDDADGAGTDEGHESDGDADHDGADHDGADRRDADDGGDRKDGDRDDDRKDDDRKDDARDSAPDRDRAHDERASARDTVTEQAWSARHWFGDDEKQVGSPAATPSQHTAAHRPAMATLVTATRDEPGGLTARHIDTRAVLAALADLHDADGADAGPYALGA